MKFSGFDGTYSACYKCNWYSSDENIFTVETKNNENGDATIKGVDVGTATLYCVSADGGMLTRLRLPYILTRIIFSISFLFAIQL